MMPTKRRERFLFYKRRSLRRRKRVYARKPQMLHGRLQIAIEIVTDGLSKQFPRDEVKRNLAYPAGSIAFNESIGDVKPDYAVLGVKVDVRASLPGWHPQNHPRAASVHYQERRVKSIPRIGQLPRRYSNPRPNPTDRAGYPYRYPSGQRNPTAWRVTGTADPVDLVDGWIGWNGWYGPTFGMYVFPTPNNVPPYQRAFYDDPEWAFWPYVPLP